MFEYRCTACGDTAYSSASYATVGICPSCESPLDEGAFVTVPEPGGDAATPSRASSDPAILE